MEMVLVSYSLSFPYKNILFPMYYHVLTTPSLGKVNSAHLASGLTV